MCINAKAGATLFTFLTMAVTSWAAEIVPVSQLRDVYADAMVMPPTQQYFETLTAPDFGDFNVEAKACVSNANAIAQALASQYSTIDGCAIIGTGSASAHSVTSANGYLALSVTLSRLIVTFEVAEQVEVLIAGTINDGDVKLVKVPSMLVFERLTEDDTLGVHHRHILSPGQYVVSFKSGPGAGAAHSREESKQGHFDLQLTLCFTPADVNVDNQVNVDDLLAVINAWGMCQAAPQPCAADITLDGFVDVTDLLEVVNAWSY
jgi:hypothetical protein